MENDMEISSTTENTDNFEDEVPYPDQIVIQQICCSDKDSPSLQNDGKDSLLNKMKRPAIDQDTKLLPPKRVRKATRKKLESLISFTEMYECSECPQTFNRLNQFRAHAKSHSSIKNEVYKCESCDEKTNNLRSLIVHRRQHHEEIECSLCHVEFESLNSLKCHMKSHKGEKPYVCKECGASFSQSGHLSIHTRTHTGEKPYTCDICNNNFKQISHLKTHVRTHTHDKPYQCNQCTAAFTQNSSLKRHKRAHTGEKPYKCLECDMTFVVKSNMQRHLNTHTGERPFQCDLCSASFGQAIDLKRHKISHTGIKPYKCDMCEAAFSRKNNLKWHKLTHSENAGYQCSICFAGFSTTGDLKAHMRNHAPPKPFSCDTCPATFRLMESLNRHRMIHTGGRPLRIKSSDKEDISLKCSKVKPYTCMTCDASFCEKRNLKRHTLSVHQNKDNMINYEILDYESVSNIKVDVGICSPSPENSLNEQDAKEFITENGQTCLHSEVITIPVSNSQHIPVMQNISSHETQMPQFLLAGPGQTARPARPAGQCQNHSLHVLTFIEGSYNHWQSWCFCDPPNIPDSTSQLISSSNEDINEGMTQILITSPIQSNLPENSPQLLMETSSSASPSNNQHIIINSVCSSDSVMAQSNSPITVDAQSLEIQGNVVSGTNIQFFKEIKAEQQDYT